MKDEGYLKYSGVNRLLKTLLPLLTFILVFVFHALYFNLANSASFGVGDKWFEIYLRLQEHYLGFSYAVSVVFVLFAFIRFK